MATTTYTWIDGTSGDWGTAADWSPTSVPDGTADASFVGSGSETVTVSTDEAVNQLTLENVGTTLTVQDNATLSVYGGLVTTAGSLNIIGNSAQATVDVFGPAGFGTPGVLTGNISLGSYSQPSNALLEFSSGQITDIAQSGSLLLFGPNARVADAGSLSGNSALQGLSTIEGTFELLGGGTLQTNGDLTNSGIWAVIGSSSTVTIGGVVTNTGGFSVNDGATVSASGFNNTGNLQVASAKLDIEGPAGFGTAGVLTGAVELEGNSVIDFASGQITDIAKGAQLGIAPNSFVEDASSPGSNSALQGLSTIEGAFQLIGSTLQTTGDLTVTDSGSVQVDDSGLTNANLSIGGMLTNNAAITIGGQFGPGGTVSAAELDNESTGTIGVGGAPNQLAALNISGPVVNDGTLTASFATVDLQGAVSGSGSVTIGYGAEIEFGSSVASTEKVIFNNFGSLGYTLKIDQPDQFSGIISGFGSSDLGNDTIELTNVQAASATPVTYSGGLTTVEVRDVASNVIANLKLLGDYTGYAFNVAGDNITTNGAAPPPPADDTPALTVPSAQTVVVGNALELFGRGKSVTVTDPDADNFGETFTVQINHSASNGTGFTILPEGATVTGSGTNNVSVAGTLAQVNAAMATLDYASNNPGAQPGTDTITFQVTDSDGGMDTKTVAVDLESSTTAPQVSESLASDTGTSPTDKITSNDTLSGSGDPNSTVHFSVDGALIAQTATADGSGAWTFTPTGLADGSHTVLASETNTAGNTGTASLTFTLDATAPALDYHYLLIDPNTGHSTGGGVTLNVNAFTLAGYLVDTSPSTQVEVFATKSGNGTAISVGSGTVDALGNFSIPTAALPDGTYTFSVTATDLAGNSTTEVGPYGLTIDTVAPSVTEALVNDTGTSSTDKITSSDTLGGSGDPNAVVHFTLDGTPTAQTATADAAGNWTFTPTGLTDSAHTVLASETDAAGNTGSASLTFTLDTTAPKVNVSLDHAGLNLAAATALVTFAFSEAVVGFGLSSVTTSGGSLGNLQTSDGGKTYTATFTATNGIDVNDATVGIKASGYQDLAGDAGSAASAGSFTVDTLNPTVSVTASNTDVNVAHNIATIAFSFSEAPTDFSLAHVSATGGTLSNLQQVNATTYTAVFTGAASTDIGTASVAVDSNWHENNGNAGTAGSTVPFVVDTVSPTVSVATNNTDVNVAHNTATITFNFSEAPTDFSLAHASATGGALANLQQVNATTYTALFTGSAGTDINTVRVAVDNTWHENNGNAGTAGSTAPFVVDTMTPSVAMSINKSHLTLSGRTATVTFSFSEAPVSFALADTATVGGVLSNLQKVNATTYTSTFTAAANISINNASASVLANSWHESNGNLGAGGATASFSVDTLDHWTNASGGSWSSASNWGNGVPAAGVAADIDRAGTYTVTISGARSTYGLLVNDAGAAVSDSKNGALTLAGAGGSTGTLTISAGTFALAGGSLTAGSISIASGGVLQISQSYAALTEAITNNGAITLASTASKGITASFKGTLAGSGTVTVHNGATAVIGTPVSGSGSFTLANNGNLEFVSADSENVTFASGATGTLKLDHCLTAPFTGKISGLTPNNAVDLADLKFTKSKSMTAAYAGNTAGGTLTVSNGSQSVSLNLLGDYTHSTWTLSKDGGSGTLVVDPSIAQAPPLVASATERHGPDIALLVSYMASAFPQSGNGHGSSLIGDGSLAGIHQQSLLAQPHHA